MKVILKQDIKGVGKKNEVITELLAKIGLLQISESSNSGKIFGLFRR